VCLAVAAAGVGCARKPPEPAPVRFVHEGPVRPATPTIALQATPPTSTSTADGREVWIDGSVRNRSTRPTTEIRVVVSGVNADGGVVSSAEASPTPQLVVPGGSARYRVRLANDPSIITFHVEAIGR
jgi:hypothetical protein